MKEQTVRVRFAPSPTGPLHVGGVRTALYNYLFARKTGGKFILRIEDTDQNRYVPRAEEYILESLRWCGIEFDEGVHTGGPFAPYRQSDRKAIYRSYAEKLVENDFAYYAFDTPAELEKMRLRLEEMKLENASYSHVVRREMKNSLSMPQSEVQSRIQAGEPFVIRFRMPENEELRIHDIVRGEVVIHTSLLDDKVLFKSDGMPTYHLANVVDDYLMKISHVIRGEEWLPSLPLHVMLYRGFGWEREMPEFAHIPLILKPDGKGKLSKRDGDRMGFPVFPLEWKNPDTGEVASGYRESGYFPDAFINILALLGWNPGTTQEILSMNELIGLFSLERVGKSGSRFDPEKARWFNHQYLMRQDTGTLADQYHSVLRQKGIDCTREFVVKVTELVRDRATFVHDLWDLSYYFFAPPQSYDRDIVRKRWNAEIPGILTELSELLDEIGEFTQENIDGVIHSFLEQKHLSMGQVMTALRLALVGSGMGPGLTVIMEMTGKNEIRNRIRKAIKEIDMIE